MCTISVGINVEKCAKCISHVQEKIPPFRAFFNGNLMFYLRLSFTKKVTSPNSIGFSIRKESEKQKQSSNDGDFVLKLRLKMLVVTVLLLPLLLRFRSLLPLTFDTLGFYFLFIHLDF